MRKRTTDVRLVLLTTLKNGDVVHLHPSKISSLLALDVQDCSLLALDVLKDSARQEQYFFFHCAGKIGFPSRFSFTYIPEIDHTMSVPRLVPTEESCRNPTPRLPDFGLPTEESRSTSSSRKTNSAPPQHRYGCQPHNNIVRMRKTVLLTTLTSTVQGFHCATISSTSLPK